ncbi:MAG: rRNA pseudouridine synthase [Segetibacter sp.]|nr:rRNA pseudouridine synthase [Segetibacter sp.]
MPARTDNFQKFVKQKKGSAIKEEIKQQKRKEKKEKAAAIEAHFERKRAERQQRQQTPAPAAPSKTGRPNKYPKKETEGTEVKTVADKPETVKISTAKSATSKKVPVKTAPTQGQVQRGTTEEMPLNKYVAHGGLCSRRDAAVWVKEGKVTVNGEVATDPGMKVSSTDVVKVGNKRVIPSRNFVYILLNKPKDYITTSEDPQGRKTVLDLVRSATDERVYPVGRLDRNTSGVLLLTNDGDLAQKLSHPKHEIKKVYEVRLDRALTKGDMDKIASGVTLEDGFVAPDVIAYADSKDKSIIGIEIHSGRNRIVRRIFEHMKYDVKGLDRVMFAGLTKKDVQRGRWRFLKEKEIRILKFMNQSFVKIKE